MPSVDLPSEREEKSELSGTDRKELIQKALSRIRLRLLVNQSLRSLFFDLFVVLSLFGGFLLVYRLIDLSVDPLAVLYGVLALSVVVSCAPAAFGRGARHFSKPPSLSTTDCV